MMLFSETLVRIGINAWYSFEFHQVLSPSIVSNLTNTQRFGSQFPSKASGIPLASNSPPLAFIVAPAFFI